MSKDPAFLFYPGDWLGGTMGMSLEEKGAYLELLLMQWNSHRIAKPNAIRLVGEKLWQALSCKFSEDEKGFFNKRLEEEIYKRRQHSEKQRDNAKKRWKKPVSDGNANALPLENEVLNENENVDKGENENSFGKSENLFVVPKMFEIFKKANPKYPGNKDLDYKPLLKIHDFLFQQGNSPPENEILEAWETIAGVISQDNFYKQKSLSTVSNHIQEITQIALHGKQSTSKNGKQSLDESKLKQKLSEHLRAREQI